MLAVVDADARGGDSKRVVATVRVDSPLPHLDRGFDYEVPAKLVDVVQVGSRVRVPFSGRLISAVVTDVGDGSDFTGALSAIRTAGARPSYTPSGIALAERVAARYGGTVWDMLRLMAPPRVAAVERRDWDADAPPDEVYAQAAAGLGASALCGAGERVVWDALPGDGAHASVAAATLLASALAHVRDGASAIVVVPDARAVRALMEVCEENGLRRWTSRSGGEVAVVQHDDGPSVRFGSYLAAMTGQARLVIGTRPTVLQPVPALGFVGVWDDGNGALDDPHAPYFSARTVAAMRAADGGALLLGGYAVSVESIALVEHGWATLVSKSRDAVRAATPTIDVLTAKRRDAEGGTGWHWMPSTAWRALSRGVERGPVGVVVPRAGYVRGTACARCDAWSACRDCEALLEIGAPGAMPRCMEGHEQPNWHCAECGGDQLKHVRQGAERVAEQLARMLGDVPLTVSTGASGVAADGSVEAGVVLATPGALPAVRGGYAHLVVLDAGVPAGMGMGGDMTALRWWLSAAALVRSRVDGGGVTVVGELPAPVVRALISWTPAEAAADAYRERQDAGLPPHRRYVELAGDGDRVPGALDDAGVSDRDPSVTVLTTPRGTGVLLPRGRAQEVVDKLAATVRDVSREGGDLRLRVDGPLELRA